MTVKKANTTSTKNTGSVASVTRPRSKARPRFWLSKVSGWNLRQHPRGIKKEWLPISNRADTTSSRLHIAYLDDRGPMKVQTQASINDFYLITKKEAKLPPLEDLECRAEVILYRAGLANSIAQARQWINHGHAYRNFNGKTKVISEGSKVYIVREGELIGLNADFWYSKARNTCGRQWNKFEASNLSGIHRHVPSYLEVDYVNGVAVLVEKPSSETLALPRGIAFNRN